MSVDPILHPERMIYLEVIAHALANTCRYNGHTKWHYSVAQHSYLLARAVPDHLKRIALLHDAGEAFVGDVADPLRPLFPEHRKLEERILRMILDKYDVDYDLMEELAYYDVAICRNEMEALYPVVDAGLPPALPGVVISEIAPRTAKTIFLKEAMRLGLRDD